MDHPLLPPLPSALFREGRWFVCFADHQGHRRQLSSRARTRSEAERMAERLHTQEAAIRRVLLANVVATNDWAGR